ncbi:MAG: hypothetical protein ACRDQ7_12375 [Haloechinothrix sp.]
MSYTSRPVPMYRDAEPNSEPSEDIVWAGTMRPGDVLHIPRGYWHGTRRWIQPARDVRGELSQKQHGLTSGLSELLFDHPVEAYLAAREQERPPPRHVATGDVFGPPAAVVCVADFPPHIEMTEALSSGYIGLVPSGI